jgi:hypothetical protein
MTYREKRFRRISPDGGTGGVPQIFSKSPKNGGLGG